MKKVLSFVLVLSMILGSFGMAFAAPATDVAGKKCEDAVNALTELGVVAGYKDGSYKPENIVTRAEMATFIIKAMGLADYAVGKSEFSDMAGHWADPFVAYAASLGFVKGNTDGTFAPDATVTYDQAITMLVQALGYDAKYMAGGYPGAFVNQAKTLGMLDGVQAGTAGANRGDVAILLYNTLPASFVRYNEDGTLVQVAITGDEEIYDTMLRRLGVVYTGSKVIIDEDDVESAAINVAKYVGAYVEVYKDKYGDIVAVNDVMSTFLTGKLNADKDTLTVDEVEYTLNNDAQTDITSPEAITFMNGEQGNLVAGSVADAETTYTFAVKLSGKTIKAVYSVSEWDVVEDGYFDENDALDIEEDAALFGVDFFKNNDQEIDMTRFELVGVDALEDIEKDDVVYVYSGSNGKITRIAVGKDVVEGTVAKVNSGSTKFTVNGKVYEEAAQLATGYVDAKAGDVVKFTLDAYGDIYDVEKISGESNYAVVLDVANGKTGLNGEDALIKLFLTDGTAKTYKLDKDIENYTTVAGTVIKVSQSATELTSGAIVEFATDKDGVVDTIAVVGGNSASNVKVSAKGTYNGKVVQKTAVLFSFDGVDETDEDSYAVVKFADILEAEIDAEYVLDDENKEIVCMLINDFTNEEGVYAMYNGYAFVDGDYKYEVTLMVGKDSKTFAATNSGYNFATATSTEALYKLDFDAAGAVKSATDLSSVTVDKITSASVTLRSTSATAIEGRYLVEGDGTTVHTLADDVLVYKWNAVDGEWTVGRTRDLHGVTTGAITMYSVNGDDLGIFDIVTVAK